MDRRKVVDEKLSDLGPGDLPVHPRSGVRSAIAVGAIDIGIVIDVRQVEKDEDLGGRNSQSLGSRANLLVVDGRAVGCDTEIVDRLALHACVTRHETGKALLVARAQRLGEGIADNEDCLPSFLRLAGRTGARPEPEPVRLPGIVDPAPDARDLPVRNEIVVMGRRRIDAGPGGLPPRLLQAGEERRGQDEIQHQGDRRDGQRQNDKSQNRFQGKFPVGRPASVDGTVRADRRKHP